jgi:predicted HTH transcriptional regulator
LGWTTERLKQLHNSVPHNPFIAHPMYLAGYIEQLGTGTEDMVERMIKNGLPEPLFVQEQDFRTIIYRHALRGAVQDTPKVTEQAIEQVTEQAYRLILTLESEMTRDELMDKLNLRHRPTFVYNYTNPALSGEWIEMTETEPNHPRQKYRLTAKGLKAKQQWEK